MLLWKSEKFGSSRTLTFIVIVGRDLDIGFSLEGTNGVDRLHSVDGLDAVFILNSVEAVDGV